MSIEPPVTTEALAAPTYARLVRVPGFRALAGSALLSRTANRMWEVGLVLFVLERYHSAPLAGLAVFLSIVPGLLLAPLAGALLDRHGRRRLIFLDNAIAGSALASIGLLAITGGLSRAALLAIVGVASLTFTLTAAGTRSLFPLVIPRSDWDLANAVDSGSEALSAVIGPALAGGLVAAIGGAHTLLASGFVYLLAGVAVLNVREPRAAADQPRVPLLRAAREGLRYVVTNPTLRSVAVVLSMANLGFGQLVVILPVLVLERLHSGAGTVGALWALSGGVAVCSGLLMGRLGTVGRERRSMALGFVLLTAGFLVLMLPSLAAVILGLILCGLAIGPIDIALFSLRQRRTDPAMFGRAFAVSMSLNYAGMPFGSGLAGPVVSRSTVLALAEAAGLNLVAAGLALGIIPRPEASAD
jgi:MFS family permease